MTKATALLRVLAATPYVPMVPHSIGSLLESCQVRLRSRLLSPTHVIHPERQRIRFYVEGDRVEQA